MSKCCRAISSWMARGDRKSTRLNSSHLVISYAVFCLKKKRIDTEGIIFEPHLSDIEVLNKNAIENVYDITKLSFAVFPQVKNNYRLLTSGSALCKGV